MWFCHQDYRYISQHICLSAMSLPPTHTRINIFVTYNHTPAFNTFLGTVSSHHILFRLINQQHYSFSFTHIMVFSVWVQTATFIQGNTFAVTKNMAGVTLAALHTSGWREVAEDGEEVWAGWGAGGSAIRVVAVWRARQGCRKWKEISMRRIKLCWFFVLECELVLLTTECVVPPADGYSSTLTGLCISLHVVTECFLHAIILTHVINAVTQESFSRHHRMAGLETVREDYLCTLSLVQLLFFCSAIRVDVWTSVWLTSKGGNVWKNGFFSLWDCVSFSLTVSKKLHLLVMALIFSDLLVLKFTIIEIYIGIYPTK